MSAGEDGAFRPVELVEPALQFPAPQTQSTCEALSAQQMGEVNTESLKEDEKEPAPTSSTTPVGERWNRTTNLFKVKKFFVLRPGTIEHAVEDVKALVNPQQDGNIEGIWLLAEVDHWNNERERLVLLTENNLLICKYDFVMLTCEQIQKVPLNLVDRIVTGAFIFPPHSLLKREGEGLRIYWDKLREPAFSSRWNPFATDYPYCTFIHHPVSNVSEKFTALCELDTFSKKVMQTAQKAHARQPVPGKANGVLSLNQPLLIEAYVGVMSFIGNQNKLGYCLARGNVGF